MSQGRQDVRGDGLRGDPQRRRAHGRRRRRGAVLEQARPDGAVARLDPASGVELAQDLAQLLLRLRPGRGAGVPLLPALAARSGLDVGDDVEPVLAADDAAPHGCSLEVPRPAREDRPTHGGSRLSSVRRPARA